MHAQTLRTYDRLGLVSPRRSSGGGRRYSQHDVDLLREVQRLSQDEGVNLAGIKRIIELTNQVEALQARLAEMAERAERLRAKQRRDVAVVPKSTALVVWQPAQPGGRRSRPVIENARSPAYLGRRSGKSPRRSASVGAAIGSIADDIVVPGREELRSAGSPRRSRPRCADRRPTARTPPRRAPRRSRRRLDCRPTLRCRRSSPRARRSGCPSGRPAGGACVGVVSCHSPAARRGSEVRVEAEAQRHRRRGGRRHRGLDGQRAVGQRDVLRQHMRETGSSPAAAACRRNPVRRSARCPTAR